MANDPYAIRSQRVVFYDSCRPATLVIDDGKIDKILEYDAVETAQDLGELVVSPGVVDPHVHINDPGRTEWETFPAATKAAVSGGVTTLVDMPLNCLPVTTTPEALSAKILTADGRLHCDVGYWAGVIPGNLAELESLIAAGVLGAKAFLVDSGIPEFPASGRDVLEPAMQLLQKHGMPLLAHAEIESDLDVTGDPTRYQTFLASRPPEWEIEAIELLLNLCDSTKCWTHIVHLATQAALPRLQAAIDAGQNLTVETCAHYLTIDAEDIVDGATQFKCCPPIRSAENNAGLWQGLKDGTISMVTTDHSPSDPALKLLEEGNFMKAWGGIASLGLELPLIWTVGQSHDVSLVELAQWLSTNTARLAGLNDRGKIAVGKRADLVVWDPDESFRVARNDLWFKHKLSPYLDRELKGSVVQTILAGEVVFDRGNFSEPSGQSVLGRR